VLAGGTGNNELEGDAGSDLVSYASLDRPIAANLAAGAVLGEGLDRLSGVERLVGTRYGDSITGGPRGDVIRGLAGPDRIAGGGGADDLFGGRGDDSMSGGAGGDRIDGGPGRDMVDGGAGRDWCTTAESPVRCP
jgi:Ca2+-binding RTX toxin-like protein